MSGCNYTMYVRIQCSKKTLPFLFFKLIDQIHFAFLGACQLGFDLLQVALGLCYILNEIRKKKVICSSEIHLNMVLNVCICA